MRVRGVSIEISLRGRCDLPAPGSCALVLHVSSACCSTAAADMNRDVARSEESRRKALVFAYPDHKITRMIAGQGKKTSGSRTSIARKQKRMASGAAASCVVLSLACPIEPGIRPTCQPTGSAISHRGRGFPRFSIAHDPELVSRVSGSDLSTAVTTGRGRGRRQMRNGLGSR